MSMKLHIRKDPEITIQRKDAIFFQRGEQSVEIARAIIGSFDATPYEPTNHTWGYRATLLQDGATLWVRICEYELTRTVQGGDWVEHTKEEYTAYQSEDQGQSWYPSAAPPPFDDMTPLDHIESR